MFVRLLHNFLLAIAIMTAVSTVSIATQTYAQEDNRAQLIQYSAEIDLKTLASKGTTVVFFFATWCPNCILTLSELSEKWSDVEPDITLVIADYDQETALKASYGVTYQDTFVMLDGDAKAAKLWNAGGIAQLNANTRIDEKTVQ